MGVRPMGGDLVLLQVEEGEDFVEFVKDEIDMFERWFNDLSVWALEHVTKERYVWIRCQGILIHAWGEDFLRTIVSSVGRYVCVDFPTVKKQRLDVARILVQVSSAGAISKLINVRINGVVFSIKLVEEPFTNPYVHIGDVYHGGSKQISSSSSDSGDSDGVSSEASLEAAVEFDFQIFLNDDARINDNDLPHNWENDFRVTDGDLVERNRVRGVES